MEQILDLIQKTPPDQFLFGLFTLFYLTGLGIIPNSTDVNMLILGAFIAEDRLPFLGVWIVCFSSLVLADHTTFMTAKVIGQKILNLKWIRRRLKEDYISSLQILFKTSPFHPILAIRLAPTGRPPLIILLSTLGYPLKIFFPFYTPFMLMYTFLIIGISYQINLYAKEYLGDFKVLAIVILVISWILLMRKIAVKFKEIVLRERSFA